jgi:predicted CXXCH cytochrome family protein
MVLLLTATWLGGAQEPVEHPEIPWSVRGEEIDFSSCSACHTDKTEGTVIHPALEMGCETCHEVDQDQDWTDVFLVAEGNELCVTCHGDKQAEPSQIDLHSPVRRDQCITCHDSHVSDNDALLRQPLEGLTREENLCLTCHDNISAQLAKENVHGAVEFGCATCHTTHKSDPVDTPEAQFHLNEAQPGLCVNCHDIEDETLVTVHSGQPFQTANCTMCHNPHGSDNAKLINNTVHGAFEMGCETCHDTPANGEVVLQEGAGKDMCLMCHEDVSEKLASGETIHFPLEMDDGCINCHNPHATTSPKLLKDGPVRTCFSCHSELAEQRAAKDFLHRPVFEQSCVICHQPHTGERERFLRTNVSELCLGCHGSQARKQLAGGQNLLLYKGVKEVSPKALQGIRFLPVRPGQTKGHPVASHPVAGEHTIKGTPQEITCVICHTPHAANGSQKLFASETSRSMEVCTKCH